MIENEFYKGGITPPAPQGNTFWHYPIKHCEYETETDDAAKVFKA